MTRRSLSRLSDNRLLSGLRQLVKKEKRTTLDILLHLAEVDRRALYLSYGFSSLFDYCAGALNYSRSAAGRRIATARAIRRFPEIYDLLDSDEVSLSTIGLIAPVLDDDNKDLLLREIRNKTYRQVDAIVAAYRPPVAYRDLVKPVRVAVPEVGQNAKNRCKSLIFNSRHGSSSPGGNGHAVLGGAGLATKRAAAHEANLAEPPREVQTKRTAPRPASLIEKRLLVQFLASEKFMAKLDEVKSLLSNKMPAGTFEDVFEVLIDEFLERHSPAKRHQRRVDRKKRAITSQKSPDRSRAKAPSRTQATKNTGVSPKPKTRPRSQAQKRHVPAALRDKIFVRDNGRCTFVGKNKRRCGSTRNLQVDHIEPVARGGTNRLQNLRLLCAKHNRLEARRILGADVMNRYTRQE